jgi:3-hydroxyisobutyrate dehydrogenase
MAKIAFLGTGAMGAPMIRCLLKAGDEVTIWNRSIDKARLLERDGAKVAATPAACVDGAQAIFTMVLDDAACRAVWTGKEGILSGTPARDVIAVESSTVSNDWVLELNGLVRAKGWRFVDCCVAGRPDWAEAGQLIAYAGGTPTDVSELTPIVRAFSKSVTRFGEAGKGNAFKLIYNVMGALQVAALAEAMQACEASGIDLHAAAAAFSGGNTGSGHVIRHSKYMATGRHPDPIGFSPRNRIKDILYGAAYIEKTGGQSMIGRAAAAVYGQAVDVGLGDVNDSELIDALREVHRQA